MFKDLRYEDYFLFTQHSLATFQNCPLKFKKRYLESLRWDSSPDESVQSSLEKGRLFHLLAQRYFLGIDCAPVDYHSDWEEVKRWLGALKDTFKLRPNITYLPEYKLRMSRGILKLEANFDLLIVEGDHVEIWDWKTHGNVRRGRQAEEKKLKEALQTMVYMFVLGELYPIVTGKEPDINKITMCYWQPEPAGIIAKIEYSSSLHEKFRRKLEFRINEILDYDYSNFHKEQYTKHCPFCEFNWFCNNEKVDFSITDENEDFVEDLDWDNVEEKF